MKLILTTLLAFSLVSITGCGNEATEGNPAGQSMDNTDNGGAQNNGAGEELNEDGNDVYNDTMDNDGMNNEDMNNQ